MDNHLPTTDTKKNLDIGVSIDNSALPRTPGRGRRHYTSITISTSENPPATAAALARAALNSCSQKNLLRADRLQKTPGR